MTEAIIIDRLNSRVDRVRDHSAHSVNQEIVRDIDRNVEHCIRGGREAISRRLAELDREWDIDRVLMANFAVAGGIAYGVGVHRYANRPLLAKRRTGFLYFFAAQLGFLLMHAGVGWCPPMVLWRRLGARTKTEIEVERSLLLAALEPPLTNGSALAGNAPLAEPQAVS